MYVCIHVHAEEHPCAFVRDLLTDGWVCAYACINVYVGMYIHVCVYTCTH